MLYFTGNLQEFEGHYISASCTRLWYPLTEKDYLFVCSDHGLSFGDGSAEVRKKLDKLEEMPYTILLLDHKGEFSQLDSYSTETWKGGKVYHIRNNILQLVHGQTYDIDGIKVLSLGAYRASERAEYFKFMKRFPRSGCEVNIVVSPSGEQFDFVHRNISLEVKYEVWYCGRQADEDICYKIRSLYHDVVGYKEELIDYSDPYDDRVIPMAIRWELEMTLIQEMGECYGLFGSCNMYWALKKSILKEKYRINWRSPKERNPGVIFD